jgi:hypothetical protein
MTSDYLTKLDKATDPFERGEINSFLNDLWYFCSFHRGTAYWQRVLTAAKNL